MATRETRSSVNKQVCDAKINEKALESPEVKKENFKQDDCTDFELKPPTSKTRIRKNTDEKSTDETGRERNLSQTRNARIRSSSLPPVSREPHSPKGQRKRLGVKVCQQQNGVKSHINPYHTRSDTPTHILRSGKQRANLLDWVFDDAGVPIEYRLARRRTTSVLSAKDIKQEDDTLSVCSKVNSPSRDGDSDVSSCNSPITELNKVCDLDVKMPGLCTSDVKSEDGVMQETRSEGDQTEIATDTNLGKSISTKITALINRGRVSQILQQISRAREERRAQAESSCEKTLKENNDIKSVKDSNSNFFTGLESGNSGLSERFKINPLATDTNNSVFIKTKESVPRETITPFFYKKPLKKEESSKRDTIPLKTAGKMILVNSVKELSRDLTTVSKPGSTDLTNTATSLDKSVKTEKSVTVKQELLGSGGLDPLSRMETCKSEPDLVNKTSDILSALEPAKHIPGMSTLEKALRSGVSWKKEPGSNMVFFKSESTQKSPKKESPKVVRNDVTPKSVKTGSTPKSMKNEPKKSIESNLSVNTLNSATDGVTQLVKTEGVKNQSSPVVTPSCGSPVTRSVKKDSQKNQTNSNTPATTSGETVTHSAITDVQKIIVKQEVEECTDGDVPTEASAELKPELKSYESDTSNPVDDSKSKVRRSVRSSAQKASALISTSSGKNKNKPQSPQITDDEASNSGSVTELLASEEAGNKGGKPKGKSVAKSKKKVDSVQGETENDKENVCGDGNSEGKKTSAGQANTSEDSTSRASNEAEVVVKVEMEDEASSSSDTNVKESFTKESVGKESVGARKKLEYGSARSTSSKSSNPQNIKDISKSSDKTDNSKMEGNRKENSEASNVEASKEKKALPRSGEVGSKKEAVKKKNGEESKSLKKDKEQVNSNNGKENSKGEKEVNGSEGKKKKNVEETEGKKKKEVESENENIGVNDGKCKNSDKESVKDPEEKKKKESVRGKKKETEDKDPENQNERAVQDVKKKKEMDKGSKEGGERRKSERLVSGKLDEDKGEMTENGKKGGENIEEITENNSTKDSSKEEEKSGNELKSKKVDKETKKMVNQKVGETKGKGDEEKMMTDDDKKKVEKTEEVKEPEATKIDAGKEGDKETNKKGRKEESADKQGAEETDEKRNLRKSKKIDVESTQSEDKKIEDKANMAAMNEKIVKIKSAAEEEKKEEDKTDKKEGNDVDKKEEDVTTVKEVTSVEGENTKIISAADEEKKTDAKKGKKSEEKAKPSDKSALVEKEDRKVERRTRSSTVEKTEKDKPDGKESEKDSKPVEKDKETDTEIKELKEDVKEKKETAKRKRMDQLNTALPKDSSSSEVVKKIKTVADKSNSKASTDLKQKDPPNDEGTDRDKKNQSKAALTALCPESKSNKIDANSKVDDKDGENDNPVTSSTTSQKDMEVKGKANVCEKEPVATEVPAAKEKDAVEEKPPPSGDEKKSVVEKEGDGEEVPAKEDKNAAKGVSGVSKKEEKPVDKGGTEEVQIAKDKETVKEAPVTSGKDKKSGMEEDVLDESVPTSKQGDSIKDTIDANGKGKTSVAEKQVANEDEPAVQNKEAIKVTSPGSIEEKSCPVEKPEAVGVPKTDNEDSTGGPPPSTVVSEHAGNPCAELAAASEPCQQVESESDAADKRSKKRKLPEEDEESSVPLKVVRHEVPSTSPAPCVPLKGEVVEDTAAGNMEQAEEEEKNKQEPVLDTASVPALDDGLKHISTPIKQEDMDIEISDTLIFPKDLMEELESETVGLQADSDYLGLEKREKDGLLASALKQASSGSSVSSDKQSDDENEQVIVDLDDSIGTLKLVLTDAEESDEELSPEAVGGEKVPDEKEAVKALEAEDNDVIDQAENTGVAEKELKHLSGDSLTQSSSGVSNDELSPEDPSVKEPFLSALGLGPRSKVMDGREHAYTGTLKTVIKVHRSPEKKGGKFRFMVKNKGNGGGAANGHDVKEKGGDEDNGRSEAERVEYRIQKEATQVTVDPTSTDLSHISRLNQMGLGNRKCLKPFTFRSYFDLSTNSPFLKESTSTPEGAEKVSENKEDSKGHGGKGGENLVIPEKSSSFSIHPGRLCSDVCSYCFGKFGSLDTPCHIAQLKSSERQQKILQAETHLTADSCLCDACYRHVDRKANCPSYNPQGTRKRIQKIGTSSRNVCCATDCTQQAMHQVRRKWIVKLKRCISKKVPVDIDRAALHQPFYLCSQHYFWVDHYMQCGLCRRRLSLNHMYLMGQEVRHVNVALKAVAVPVALCEKIFVCKHCRYFCQLSLRYHENQNISSSNREFCENYRKKILYLNDIEVSDSDDKSEAIFPPKSKKKKSKPSAATAATGEGATGAAVDAKDKEAAIPLTLTASIVPVVTLDAGDNSSDSGDSRAGAATPTIDYSSLAAFSAPDAQTAHAALLSGPASSGSAAPAVGRAPQQAAGASKGPRMRVKLGSLDPSTEIHPVYSLPLSSAPAPAATNVPAASALLDHQQPQMQATFDFRSPYTSGSRKRRGDWETCNATLQFTKETKRDFVTLQRPYGNYSSFMRHLVLLEKYWRSGDLVLSPGASQRASSYIWSVENRIKALDGTGSQALSLPPPPPPIAQAPYVPPALPMVTPSVSVLPLPPLVPVASTTLQQVPPPALPPPPPVAVIDLPMRRVTAPTSQGQASTTTTPSALGPISISTLTQDGKREAKGSGIAAQAQQRRKPMPSIIQLATSGGRTYPVVKAYSLQQIKALQQQRKQQKQQQQQQKRQQQLQELVVAQTQAQQKAVTAQQKAVAAQQKAVTAQLKQQQKALQQQKKAAMRVALPHTSISVEGTATRDFVPLIGDVWSLAPDKATKMWEKSSSKRDVDVLPEGKTVVAASAPLPLVARQAPIGTIAQPKVSVTILPKPPSKSTGRPSLVNIAPKPTATAVMTSTGILLSRNSEISVSSVPVRREDGSRC